MLLASYVLFGDWRVGIMEAYGERREGSKEKGPEVPVGKSG